MLRRRGAAAYGASATPRHLLALPVAAPWPPLQLLVPALLDGTFAAAAAPNTIAPVLSRRYYQDCFGMKLLRYRDIPEVGGWQHNAVMTCVRRCAVVCST